MRQNRHRAGVLVEVLVSSLVALFVGAGLVQLVQVDGVSTSLALGQNNADSQTRLPLDVLVDNIRRAYPYKSATPSCVEAAGATTIAVYTDSAGNYVTYSLDTSTSPATLKRTKAGVSTVIVTGVTSLQFTYYTSAGLYTTTGNSWVTTVNPNSPTATELPTIASVGISLTMTINGYSRTLSSFVRLRNSPAYVN